MDPWGASSRANSGERSRSLLRGPPLRPRLRPRGPDVPGLRGDWQGALDAFRTSGYVNEIGVQARADRIEEVRADLDRVGMSVIEWSGVRVFDDAISPRVAPPSGAELEQLLDAEDLAGRQDPSRWTASQLHLIAGRAAA